MNDISRLKLAILAAGDIVLMYFSLVVMLIIRYHAGSYNELIRYHLVPFTILFFLWLILFYIGGLYDLKNLKNGLAFKRNFSFILFLMLLVAILFFYLITSFGVSPKTNLLLFFILFGVLEYIWRHIYNIVLATTMRPLNLTIIGSNKDEELLMNYITGNPQLGYRIRHKIETIDKNFEEKLTETDMLVIPDYIKKDKLMVRHIYNTIFKGILVKDVSTFYEEIFGKIPLSELEESWVIENLSSQHSLFDTAKRPIELGLAFILTLICLPVIAVIVVMIELTSRGSIIYKQQRVGRYEKKFILYKFRTMVTDAESEGPQWAEEDDSRVTTVGRFLRRTHLDELPQLINVIQGDLSFVGPRPERPEFVERLKKKIPYYEVRHIVKPGITGWAQINYKYASSIDDTYEKLQFDIYYLKKRSLVLDLLILLKTMKTLFINP
jgi:exopolysaccharide biosynthesis polyprenyl glycosylphosphotransferase